MVMDIRALLEFIESHCEKACSTVDLRDFAVHSRRRGPLRLIFDAEPCLVFFYGGQSGDWVSGGQWNNTVRFLQDFFEACIRYNIEATVFFNGVSARERYGQWCENQLLDSRHIQDIVRLIRTKAFHPSKRLWVAPCGLTSVLRFVMNHIGIPTVSSYRDHSLEVISYARENGFDGIVSWDVDLIMFHAPPRYFSARNLFLSYNGTFNTIEVDVEDFARTIDLHPSRFSILASLLGNHILPAAQLQEFYARICHLSSSVHAVQHPFPDKVRAVIDFLRKLPSTDDLNEVARAVFGPGSVNSQAAEQFKKSVEYYRKGKETGLSPKNSSSVISNSHSSYSSPRISDSGTSLMSDHSRIPGDGVDKDVRLSSAQSYLFSTVACIRVAPPPPHRQCSAPPAQTLLLGGWDEEYEPICMTESEVQATMMAPKVHAGKAEVALQSRSSVDYTTLFGSGGYSSYGYDYNSSASSSGLHPLLSPIPKWWKVAPEVLKTAEKRHRKAVMMPWVYQVLTHGELFLPPLLEDDNDTSLTKAIDLFRPLRRRVYSVLLERNSERVTDSDAVVREWWFIQHASMASIPTFSVVEVPIVPSAPSLQQLWFGLSEEDIMQRQQSFLDCFGCLPIQHLLLNPTNIKSHFLILCCILRYLVIQKSILIADENVIQGFLATAVSNRLHDPKAIRELNIPVMSMRSIQLATLFMHGFENVLFAHEAFGSPLPVDLFCPSQYFDGKLFHYKMAKIGQKASLSELCENSLEQQMYVERMQHAITSSLPKDCAYSRPFLWNRSTVPPDPVLGNGPGLLTRDQGLYGSFPGRRGKLSNPNSFSREIICQPAGSCGIPYPDEKYFEPLLDTPPSRVMRVDARTRHSRGRQKHIASSKKGKVEPIQRESRPSRGHLPIATASRRGAIGHRSEFIAPGSIAPGYGRGRGCTVDMEIPSCSETPPVILTLEASVERWKGKGRSLSSRTTDAKVGLQQAAAVLTLEDTKDSQFTQLKGDMQQTHDSTQFCDAEGHDLVQNQHETDSDKQECKRIVASSPEPPSDNLFLSMPPLIKKSNALSTGARWSDLVEAELFSFSQLTVEGDESKLMLSNEGNQELDKIPGGEQSVLVTDDSREIQNDQLQRSDQLADSSTSQKYLDAVDTQEPAE